MQNNNKKIWWHILGCLIVLLLPILFSPDIGRGFAMFEIRPFQRSLLATTLLLLFFYLNYYLFIPKFYLPKKYIWFFGIALFSFIVIMLLSELPMMGHHHPMRDEHFKGPNFGPPKKPFLFLFNHSFIQFIAVLIFSIMLHLRERLKQIETEKTNAELSYLKAQINPHFLFNTLNSIYSLAIQKHERTPEAVVKLSDMMRYVLSDGNSSFVLLEKELNYINNYIDLQKMRLSSMVQLNYKAIGLVMDQKVAPLILIPFIENAFKHGVSSEEQSEIDIEIIITDIQLKLMVKNLCVKINNNTLNKSGLGIENTKKRLELLYPKSHELSIVNKDDYFIVNLILNLHD